MDRRQIGTRLVLKELEQGENGLRDFSDRLILQKTIYLAQEAGVNLGYYFSWYLKGPYCTALTNDAFAIREEVESDFDSSEGWELDSKSKQRLVKLKQILPSGDKESRARTLELLASVHFLIDRGQVNGVDASAIRDLLLKYKKSFSEPEIKDAITNLRQVGLLKHGSQH